MIDREFDKPGKTDHEVYGQRIGNFHSGSSG